MKHRFVNVPFRSVPFRSVAVGGGLNERSRRLFAAAEAKAAWHGGIASGTVVAGERIPTEASSERMV
jgi:hypothetical protein